MIILQLLKRKQKKIKIIEQTAYCDNINCSFLFLKEKIKNRLNQIIYSTSISSISSSTSSCSDW